MNDCSKLSKVAVSFFKPAQCLWCSCHVLVEAVKAKKSNTFNSIYSKWNFEHFIVVKDEARYTRWAEWQALPGPLYMIDKQK